MENVGALSPLAQAIKIAARGRSIIQNAPAFCSCNSPFSIFHSQFKGYFLKLNILMSIYIYAPAMVPFN
ncbi:MAG: hypothetical protein EUB_01208 [Eubacterium sp.]